MSAVLNIDAATATLANADAPADQTLAQAVAMGAAANLNIPREKQSALLAFLKRSLDPIGSAYKEYCTGATPCTVATGVAGGRIGLWHKLYTTYHTPDIPVDKSTFIDDLSKAPWPEGRSVELWQEYVAKITGIVRKCNMDNDAMAPLWIEKLTKPTADIWMDPVNRVKGTLNYVITDAAQRADFITRVTSDVSGLPKIVDVPSSRAARRAVVVDKVVDKPGDFAVNCQCASPVCYEACSGCVDEFIELETHAAATGRARAVGDRGAKTRTTRKFSPRKCPRCDVLHGANFNCVAKCDCPVCGSKDHCAAHCWIGNGLPTYARLPAYVMQQYIEWHKQHKAGTYRKEANGPSRVRPPLQSEVAARSGEIDPGDAKDASAGEGDDGLSIAERRQVDAAMAVDAASMEMEVIGGGAADVVEEAPEPAAKILVDADVLRAMIESQQTPPRPPMPEVDSVAVAKMLAEMRVTMAAQSEKLAGEMQNVISQREDVEAERGDLRQRSVALLEDQLARAKRDLVTQRRESEEMMRRTVESHARETRDREARESAEFIPPPATNTRCWACRRGHRPGIYDKYDPEVIRNFSGSEHKSFSNLEDARAYMEEVREPATCILPFKPVVPKPVPENAVTTGVLPWWWFIALAVVMVLVMATYEYVVGIEIIRPSAVVWTNHMLVDAQGGNVIGIVWRTIITFASMLGVFMFFKRMMFPLLAWRVLPVAAAAILSPVSVNSPDVTAVTWVDGFSPVQLSPWLFGDGIGSLATSWGNNSVAGQGLTDGTIGEVRVSYTWDELMSGDFSMAVTSEEFSTATVVVDAALASAVALKPAVRRQGPRLPMANGATRAVIDTGAEAVCLDPSVESSCHVIQESPKVVVRTADGKISRVKSLVAVWASMLCDDSTYSGGLIAQALMLTNFPKTLWSVSYAADVLDVQTVFGSKSVPDNMFLFPNGQTSSYWGPPYSADIFFSKPGGPLPIEKFNACASHVLGSSELYDVYDVSSAEPGVATIFANAGMVSEATYWKWHNRCMHASGQVLENAPSVCNGMGITGKLVAPPGTKKCDPCQCGKANQRSINEPQSDIEITFAGQGTQCDHWGPAVECLYYTGCRYAIGFRDAFTRFAWVVLVKNRSAAECINAFKIYCAVCRKRGFTVCGVDTDGITEYVSEALYDFCDDWAIERHVSCRYTSQQAGLIERVWGVSFPKIRAVCHQAKVPLRNWGLVLVQWVNFVMNWMPHPAFDMLKSPAMMTPKGGKGNLRNLRCLFTVCWVVTPKEVRENKISPTATRMYVCGLSDVYKGWIVCDPVTQTYQHSYHVRFDEDTFYFHDKNQQIQLAPLPPMKPAVSPRVSDPLRLRSRVAMGDVMPEGVPPDARWIAGTNRPTTAEPDSPANASPETVHRGATRQTDGMISPGPMNLSRVAGIAPGPIQTTTLAPHGGSGNVGARVPFAAGDSDDAHAGPPDSTGAVRRLPPQLRRSHLSRDDPEYTKGGPWESTANLGRRERTRAKPYNVGSKAVGIEPTIVSGNGVTLETRDGFTIDHVLFDAMLNEAYDAEFEECKADNEYAACATQAMDAVADAAIDGGDLLLDWTSSFMAMRTCVKTREKVILTDLGLKAKRLPADWNEMRTSPDAPLWWAACLRELDSHYENRTWDPEPVTLQEALDDDGIVVGCKWVPDLKTDSTTHELLLYKNRLVAFGNETDPDDYVDVYSGVVRYSTIRVTSALATLHGWECTCMDVKTAFLQAPLSSDRKMYMKQPPGCRTKTTSGETLVLRLRQSIYGLRESSSEWGAVLRDWLMGVEKVVEGRAANVEFHCVRSGSDAQMYICTTSRGILIILVYVDDLIMFCSCPKMREDFSQLISARFNMKDLGYTKKALGMDFAQDVANGKLKLSLKSYIESVEERCLVAASDKQDTPLTRKMAAECEQSVPTDSEIQQCLEEYTRATGVVIFAASSVRVECGFVAHFMSRYMHKPGPKHVKMARRVLGYLVHTKSFGLEYNGSPGATGGITMEGPTSSDPEYVSIRRPIGASDSNHDVRPSVTAYVFMLAGAAVLWMCRLQKVPSISSTESEFYSLSSCVAMSVHLRNMVEEAGFPMDGPMSIMCDSRGARMLAKHNRSTPRTRHLHRRWFFVTHYERTDKVKVEEVSSEGNWSNILTKPLGVTAFWTDCGRLGLMNTW